MWGIVFAIGATGFIVGGALIGKFGLGSIPCGPCSLPCC